MTRWLHKHSTSIKNFYFYLARMRNRNSIFQISRWAFPKVLTMDSNAEFSSDFPLLFSVGDIRALHPENLRKSQILLAFQLDVSSNSYRCTAFVTTGLVYGNWMIKPKGLLTPSSVYLFFFLGVQSEVSLWERVSTLSSTSLRHSWSTAISKSVLPK